MARRQSNTATLENQDTPTPEVEDSTTQPEPEQVPDTEPEQGEDTEGSTEQGDGTEGEGSTEGEDKAKADKPIDLSAFQAKAVETLAEGDPTTGELPLAAIEPVNVEYRKLDGTKAKNAAKTWLEDRMKAALMGGEGYDTPNFQHARSFVQMKDNLSAAKGASKESAPADPVAAFVQRRASLILADRIVSAQAPEVAEDRDLEEEIGNLVTSLNEQVEAYLTWQSTEPEEGAEKPDAPEVSPIVKAALKLSTGKAAKSGGGSKGPSTAPSGRSVAKHVVEAFADKETGTFLTVAELAKFQSSEYGDDRPSQGAVQARLFPDSGKPTTIPGVKAVDKGERGENSPRGAIKL